jgi:hypothetical protein
MLREAEAEADRDGAVPLDRAMGDAGEIVERSRR